MVDEAVYANTSGTDMMPEMGDAAEMIQRNNLQSKRALLLKYLDTALEDYSEGRVEGEGVSGFPMPAAQFEKVYNDARQGVLDNFGKEVWQLNTPAGRANFEDAKNEIISECDSKYAKSCRLNTERGRKWAQDEIALHWERDIQDPFYSGRYTFGGGREGPQSRELDPVVNVCDPAVDVTAVMNMRPQDTGDCPRVKLFLKDVQTLERKLREEVLPVRCADVSIIDKSWLQHSEANVEAMRAQLRSRNQSIRQSWYERKIREHELRKTQAEVEKAKQETAQVKDKNSREMAAMRADNAQLGIKLMRWFGIVAGAQYLAPPIVGATVGGAIGAAITGPAGAAVGFTIGTTVGASVAAYLTCDPPGAKAAPVIIFSLVLFTFVPRFN